MKLLEKLQQYKDAGIIPEKYAQYITYFFQSFKDALKGIPFDFENQEERFLILLEIVKEQCLNPYKFELFHQKIVFPFDYHRFGIEIFRPLIDVEKSTINDETVLEKIVEQLDRKENAIFLANHQTETDPQLLSLLFEKRFSKLGEDLIYVAGERVTTDPLAIPFSMGCNLLCIYSKKYINYPQELKHQKQLHNQRSMRKMSELLSEGGKCIYVAPSGGRDRPNAQGVVEVAPFDPDSIEMFRLMANHAKNKTHFYPMALSTYDILPPPNTTDIELGEKRLTKRSDIHVAIGPECSMQIDTTLEKQQRREALAHTIWSQVVKDYRTLIERKNQAS
ncbi:MAG: 1-acyl-sn-glycerol-3-phosphate acyltransferase [Parachlamydiales bacterium]|nr:1-acyl-sn-glycerol-3-phosphate acyltransferase [Parachlamydiales bacterium]